MLLNTSDIIFFGNNMIGLILISSGVMFSNYYYVLLGLVLSISYSIFYLSSFEYQLKEKLEGITLETNGENNA